MERLPPSGQHVKLDQELDSSSCLLLRWTRTPASRSSPAPAPFVSSFPLHFLITVPPKPSSTSRPSFILLVPPAIQAEGDAPHLGAPSLRAPAPPLSFNSFQIVNGPTGAQLFSYPLHCRQRTTPPPRSSPAPTTCGWTCPRPPPC